MEECFQKAVAAADPDPSSVALHEFAPSPVTDEKGERAPAGAETVIMVDAALHAMDEILRTHPEALFYGQDVGRRLEAYSVKRLPLLINTAMNGCLTPRYRKRILLDQP